MKKLNPIMLIAVALPTLMGSCGDNGNEFLPALDVNTDCSISVVGDYSNFEALENEFVRFNQYYPNVKLSYEKLDGYKNNLALRLEGNNKANIFFSYTWMINNEAYAPVISHMEDLSNPSLKINLNAIRPGLLHKDSENHVYMVPVFSRSYGMLVNENIFAKEGLSVPTSWGDLLSASNSLKEKGYISPMMGYSKDSSSCLMNTIAYPIVVSTLAGNPEALALANSLNPQAGEYIRAGLTKVKEVVDNGLVNLTECDKIKDNYNEVVLRFFEGDVPMMICAGDTVSGTKKRESQSTAFINNPFSYSFHPIPLTDKGGYFIDSPSVEFSVNKDCENLDMTNEFMRFLVRDVELKEMASQKRLITPTKEMSFDSIYAPFGKIPAERTFSPEVIGIKDPLAKQVRIGAYKVGKNELTIDEAVAKYGTLE